MKEMSGVDLWSNTTLSDISRSYRATYQKTMLDKSKLNSVYTFAKIIECSSGDNIVAIEKEKYARG